MQSTFSLMEDISSAKAKWDETQLFNTMRMHPENFFTKWEKSGRVTTLNELVDNLMSAFILEICFILLPFKARHSV